mmetsp:Transcript_25480/g.54826  ORF Transcript_25480/g.54826 Transcript_25480/m.54826 type:complete len:171 (-) Transcript_25480:2863-3375(-)
MDSNGDSSENETGPDLPAGVLRSRGGWADSYNLEMEHQRERLRAATDADGDEHDGAAREKAPSHAAVDLSQFRNEEVGKGYQAKHVVRQKGATSSATGVVDMAGGKFSRNERGGPESSSATKKRSRDGGGKDDIDGRKRQTTAADRLGSYLNCKGMREFMKDIDKILKQR